MCSKTLMEFVVTFVRSNLSDYTWNQSRPRLSSSGFHNQILSELERKAQFLSGSLEVEFEKHAANLNETKFQSQNCFIRQKTEKTLSELARVWE